MPKFTREVEAAIKIVNELGNKDPNTLTVREAKALAGAYLTLDVEAQKNQAKKK